MLIISKYKDYYDSVVASTGIDKTVVFNRIPNKVIDIPKEIIKHFKGEYLFSNNKPKIKQNKKYINYNWFIVGFCGKTYLGFKFYINESSFDIIYDFEEAREYLIEFDKWNKKQNAVEKFKNIAFGFESHKFNIKFRCPYFIYKPSFSFYVDQKRIKEEELFEINPILKYYEFFKVKDTYQTFQEIQSFISGVLGNKEKEIITISDKYKIEQFGFDNIWSFRNQNPSKRKQK